MLGHDEFSKSVCQVQIFEYSVHLLGGVLYDKMRCGILFRRSQSSWSLLAWLVHQNKIHTTSSHVLSELLAMNDLKTAKSANKATKIRKLLTLDEVRKQCSEQETQKVEALLKEQEDRRKKKTQDSTFDENEEDEDAA